MNMNHHIEHHLYPQVPFYALPDLSRAIASQLPGPDPGFFRTNWEVLTVVLRRSLGRNTRAPNIRQAPPVSEPVHSRGSPFEDGLACAVVEGGAGGEECVEQRAIAGPELLDGEVRAEEAAIGSEELHRFCEDA